MYSDSDVTRNYVDDVSCVLLLKLNFNGDNIFGVSELNKECVIKS